MSRFVEGERHDQFRALSWQASVHNLGRPCGSLARFRRSCFWALSEPSKLGLDSLFEPLRIRILDGFPCRSRLEILPVRATVWIELVVVHLNDGVNNSVQQISVVGNEEQCRCESLDVVLKPIDRVNIEMVGRLIKNEQITVGGEGDGEGETLALTAAQLGDELRWLLEAKPVRERDGFAAEGHRIFDGGPGRKRSDPGPGMRPAGQMLGRFRPHLVPQIHR